MAEACEPSLKRSLWNLDSLNSGVPCATPFLHHDEEDGGQNEREWWT